MEPEAPWAAVTFSVTCHRARWHPSGKREHRQGLTRAEADAIFDETYPHARACTVTKRGAGGRPETTWHRAWLPPSRWHEVRPFPAHASYALDANLLALCRLRPPLV